METIGIDILNPKAKNLLKDLADLNLIKINKEKKKSDFSALLKKLRSKSKDETEHDASDTQRNDYECEVTCVL